MINGNNNVDKNKTNGGMYSRVKSALEVLCTAINAFFSRMAGAGANSGLPKFLASISKFITGGDDTAGWKSFISSFAVKNSATGVNSATRVNYDGVNVRDQMAGFSGRTSEEEYDHHTGKTHGPKLGEYKLEEKWNPVVGQAISSEGSGPSGPQQPSPGAKPPGSRNG